MKASFLFSALLSLVSLAYHPCFAKEAKHTQKIEKEIYFTATSKDKETGLPLIFRVTKPPESFKRNDYPQMVVGTWRYDSSVKNGMPDEATIKLQLEFEEMLGPVDPNGMGYLPMVVTGNGKKQWFWYAKDMASQKKHFKKLFSGKQAFPITFNFGLEPNWETYSNFISTLDRVP